MQKTAAALQWRSFSFHNHYDAAITQRSLKLNLNMVLRAL